MAELSIKIKIGNREYPMKVRPEEEERVRSAGKALHNQIRSYRDKFGIDDQQDLLAMVAFDCMIEKLKSEEQSVNSDHQALSRISQLNQLISEKL